MKDKDSRPRAKTEDIRRMYVVPAGRNGNSKKNLERDSKRGIIILPPVSFEEHVVVQRKTKAKTLLLQSLSEDHMADFHHLDDAKEIWLAVKASFGGNEESKKMRKTILKQAFLEFSVSEEEGLHKGYDRFQKILSQLNQMQAKPDNDDVNIKFLRALPPSWSQVALTLKTKGGLEYISFDDLYNKLRSLEIDVKGGSSYGSRSTTVALPHSAFIGAASTNTKMVYSNQPSYSSSIPSGSIMEDVLHSFVAENKPTQQLAYEDFEQPTQQLAYKDFEQVDQLEMEELDIKWQMAMLSLRINKFQKKAGRKINFNNKDSARFDKRKARCYNCLQLGHFARESNVKKVDEKARYSAFKISEVKTEEPKAMVSVDSMLNWNEHEAKNKTEEAEQVYGLMAGFESDFAVHAGNAAGCVNPAAAKFTMMGISPKVQTCPFGCDSQLFELKKNYEHLEKLYNDSFIQVQAHKNTVKTLELQKDWYHQTQLALEEKVRILSANLENTTNILKYSETLYDLAKTKKQETKLGLGFKEYIGSDEVCDRSTPSVFDPEHEDREVKSLCERFVKAGKMHAVPPPITGTFMPTSYKSDLVKTQATFGSKSNTSSFNTYDTNDFISCDNSYKSSASETYDFTSCVSSPKTNDSFSTVDVKILPKSDVKDLSPTNGFPSCSFKENVKPTKNLCNKSGLADRIHCKNNFVRSKKCFVYGSKSHLIKDYDVYDTVDNFPSVVSKAASVPAGSRHSSASTSAGRSIPAASRNRPASIHASRHIPAGRINKPAPFLVHPHMNKDNGIFDSGCSRSMTENKEKLDDFVQVKGDTVTFRGGEQSPFTDDECLVLTKEFQLPDESQVVLRNHRRHDLYTFNISDIQPEQHINCLLAKASLEESTKWHRRMVHVNFKTINKLAKHGLVGGLPLKLFTNEHNCVACNKGKQHKASYKAISAMRTISVPFQLLHMDLFGPTSIRSIDHKYYSLVIIDDFSRDYSNARTPQQNGVAKTKNITLIEAARSMLADSKLPTMFWTEAISTACYVLNRVSISNPHNKTPYELLSGKGKLITVFLLGILLIVRLIESIIYPAKVEETLNLRYLEDKPNIQGLGQEWYFDLDYLTDSLGYKRFKTNPPAGKHDTNIIIGTQDDDSESKCDEQVILVPSFPFYSFSGPKVHDVSSPMENNLDYAEELARLQRQEHEAHSAATKYGFEFSNKTTKMLHQAGIETRRNLVLAAGDPAGSIVSTGGVPVGSVPAGSIPTSSVPAGSVPASHVPAGSVPASHVPASSIPAGGVLAGSIDFVGFSDPVASESVPAVFTTDHTANSPLPPGHSLTQVNTLYASNVAVDPIATKRVNTIHPQSQIIGELQSLVWKLVPLPTGKIAIGTKWILKNKRDARGIVVRNKASLVAQGHRQEKGIDYDEVFAPVARIEAIRLFLALASYIGFMVYQMDVKSAFLYGEIKGKVYVTQPKGFEDPHNPKHVYRVFKALGTIDKTLFLKKDSRHIILVQVYVDGIIFDSTNKACQYKYVKDMLKKFDMESVRTTTTPYELLKHKSKDEPNDAVNVHLYRSMIGSLMYLTSFRPDIMFAVSACSRHQLEAYNDSDYAGSYGDRKSTTGGCQFLGRRLISWLCKKQTVVVTSSTEAEYVAAASCCSQSTLGCSIPRMTAVSCGCLLYAVQIIGRSLILLVVPVFLLVVLVPADGWVPTGSCTIPTGSGTIPTSSSTIPTGSYTLPAGSYSFMLLG
nr:hypothetical protein [Tanacetum cinerariifolium]